MAKVNGTIVRAAMIGAGGMATSVHYPSIHSLSDVEFVGTECMRRSGA